MLELHRDDLGTLELDNPEGRFICTAVDIGWPEIVEATHQSPGKNGVVDLTEHYGARAVTLTVEVQSGSSSESWPTPMPPNRGWLLNHLARYMDPSRRVRLRYRDSLGGAGGQAVREMVLSPRAMISPLSGQDITTAQLQFLCPSGVSQAIAELTSTVAPFDTNTGGTTFPRQYQRTYGPIVYSEPVYVPASDGQVPPEITLTFRGQIKDAELILQQWGDDGFDDEWTIFAVKGDIPNGQTLTVDIENRKVSLINGSTSTPSFSMVDLSETTWRLPRAGWFRAYLDSDTHNSAASCVITYRFRYLI